MLLSNNSSKINDFQNLKTGSNAHNINKEVKFCNYYCFFNIIKNKNVLNFLDE